MSSHWHVFEDFYFLGIRQSGWWFRQTGKSVCGWNCRINFEISINSSVAKRPKRFEVDTTTHKLHIINKLSLKLQLLDLRKANWFMKLTARHTRIFSIFCISIKAVQIFHDVLYNDWFCKVTVIPHVMGRLWSHCEMFIYERTTHGAAHHVNDIEMRVVLLHGWKCS